MPSEILFIFTYNAVWDKRVKRTASRTVISNDHESCMTSVPEASREMVKAAFEDVFISHSDDLYGLLIPNANNTLFDIIYLLLNLDENQKEKTRTEGNRNDRHRVTHQFDAFFVCNYVKINSGAPPHLSVDVTHQFTKKSSFWGESNE